MQQLLRFSTDALPERDRLAIWCEVISRYIVKVQVESIGSGPFSQTTTLRSLPGLSLALLSSTAFRVTRNKQLIGDGNDDLDFVVNIAGRSQYRQLGREMEVASLEGVLISNAEESSGLVHASPQVLIRFPRQTIASMVKDPEAMLCRRLPRTEALRLLVSSIQSADPLRLDSPGLSQAFATHLQDLMALAIGATRDGEEVARGRGLRAARLSAIMRDIGARLGSSELSINALALRHGVSPRYIQQLFETEGTTFTEYVMEQRLVEASRMFSDPRFADRTISEVAGNVGFGDLSYFTRSFRRRFGMTPSDARELARRESGTAF